VWFQESNATLNPTGELGIFGVGMQIESGITDRTLSSLSKISVFRGILSVAFEVGIHPFNSIPFRDFSAPDFFSIDTIFLRGFDSQKNSIAAHFNNRYANMPANDDFLADIS